LYAEVSKRAKPQKWGTGKTVASVRCLEKESTELVPRKGSRQQQHGRREVQRQLKKRKQRRAPFEKRQKAPAREENVAKEERKGTERRKKRGGNGGAISLPEKAGFESECLGERRGGNQKRKRRFGGRRKDDSVGSRGESLKSIRGRLNRRGMKTRK